MTNDQDKETAKLPARRRRLSSAERAQYLRQWESSGLSAAAFAKRHPVKAKSLYRWRRVEESAKPRRPDGCKSAFRELKVRDIGASPSAQAPGVTIKSHALEVSISGVELDARFCAFLKLLSKEVLGV